MNTLTLEWCSKTGAFRHSSNYIYLFIYIFLLGQELSFRLKKQASKNVVETTFKVRKESYEAVNEQARSYGRCPYLLKNTK